MVSELSTRNEESDKIHNEMESVMDALKDQLRGKKGFSYRLPVIQRNDFPASSAIRKR